MLCVPLAGAQQAGGTAIGDALLVARPAIAGKALSLNGTLGAEAAGRAVVLEARARPEQDWTEIARAQAASDGSFRAAWRGTRAGRYEVRARLASTAHAVQATAPPTTVATVYRGATATWYSQPGSRTACGTRLRRSTIGLAHRTLPCGSLVDVTYRGRTLSVPVIDRGPFVRGVHYDLTLAAAKVLRFVAAGRVRVGVLPAGERAPQSPLGVAAPGRAGGLAAGR